jgi:hypothetical protein
MKWLKWVLVIMLVIGAIVVFSNKLFNRQNTFYYYPEWNAYYDTRHKNYIYSIDGGKTWDTITNSSNNIAQTLGQKIVLHSNSDKIWLDNAEHRSLYSGELNDLVGNFLKLGEDKRPAKKKIILKDSTESDSDQADSLWEDSSREIKNWITETSVEQNLAKKKDSAEEEETIPQDTQNTEVSLEDSTEANNY